MRREREREGERVIDPEVSNLVKKFLWFMTDYTEFMDIWGQMSINSV